MSSYRDRKRTASDLVHRKNRINQKKKEADEPPQLDSIVDSFAASLFGPAPTAAPEPEVAPSESASRESGHEEPQVHAEPEYEEPEYEDAVEEELGYEDAGYVEETHSQVAAEAEEDYDETATAVSGEDINYNDIEYEEDQYAIEVTDDEDIETQYAEEDSQQLHELHEEAQRVEAERYIAENDARDANNLASEKLEEQRSAIAQLQQNIEQGRAAIASIREQAQAAYDEAVREFDENNATLQSLVAERDQLAADFEQQKVELQNRAESQNSHNAAIVEQINVETQAIEQRKAELAQLHGEIAEPAEVEAHREQLAHLQAEQQELVEAIQHFQAQRDSQTESQGAELAAIVERIAAESASLEQQREELQRLQAESIDTAELDARRVELANLESEQNELLSGIEQAQAALQQQADSHNQELALLTEQVDLERQRIAAHKEQLQLLQGSSPSTDDLEERQQELAALQTTNTELLQAIEEATDEAERVRAESETEQGELEEQLAGLRESVESRRQQLEELRAVPVPRVSPELQSEVRTLADKVAELDHDIARTTDARQAVDNDVLLQEQALTKQRDELQSKIAKARVKLDELQSVDVTEADVESRQAEIQTLHNDFFRVKAAIAEAMNDFVARKRDAEEKQSQHSRLVAELTERLDEQNRSLTQLRAEPLPGVDEALVAEVDGLSQQSNSLQLELENEQQKRGEAAYAAEQHRLQLLEQRDDLKLTLEKHHSELASLQQLVDPGDSEEITGLAQQIAELDREISEARDQAVEAQRVAAENTERQQHRVFQLRADVELRTDALARLREAPQPQVPVELETEINSLTEQLAGLEEGLEHTAKARETAAAELREQMQGRIVELQSEISVRTDELEQLRNAPAPEEPAELIADVSSLTEQGTELKRQFELLREDRVETEAQIAQSTAKLEQRKQELIEQRDALQISLESDRAALEQLRAQMPDVSEVTTALDQQITELHTESQRIEEEAEQVRSHVAEAERVAAEQAEQKHTQIAELRRVIETQRQSLEELKAQPAPAEPIELDDELYNLTEQSTALATEIERLTAEHAAREAAAAEKKGELERKRDALLASLSGQQEQLTLFSQQDTEEPEELRTLAAELETLSAEAERLEIAKREEAERLDAEQQQAIATANARVEKLRAEIESDRSSLESLRQATVDDSAVAELRAEVEKLLSESSQVQEEIRTLTEQRQTAEQAARETQSALELERTSLAGELEGHRRTLEALQAEPIESDALTALQAEVESLIQQQSELTASIEAAQTVAQARKAEAENQRAEFESRIQTLGAELESEKQKLASLQETEESPSNSEYEQQIAELTEQLNKAREEVHAASQQAATAREAIEIQQREFEHQRAELQKQIEMAKTELSGIQLPDEPNPADVEIRKAELQTLIQERDGLAVELQNAEQTSAARTEAIRVQAEEHKQQIEFLKAGIEANRRALEDLASSEVDSESEALQADLQRLQAQSETIQADLRQKQEAVAARKTEADQQREANEQRRAAIRKAIESDQAELNEVNEFLEGAKQMPNASGDLEQLTNERKNIADRLADARRELAAAAEAKARMEEQQKQIEELRQGLSADQAEIKSIGKEVQAIRERASQPNPDLAALMKQRTASLKRLEKAREILAREQEAEDVADERVERDKARLRSEIEQAHVESRLVIGDPAQSQVGGEPKPSKLVPFEPIGDRPPVSAAKQTKFRKRRSTHPDNLRDKEDEPE